MLAYELFSGRHPFDGRTPLEALQEQRAPAPNAQLDLHQWNALERGLALYRARRTASVAAFLAELGITGQETLRAVREEAPKSDPAAQASAAREPEPPARTADLPVIGDFSGSWEVGATRSEISLPFEPRRPANRAAGDPLRIDPQDARRYAERAGGRGEPRRRGSAIGIAPFALLAAAVAAAVYLNYESLRDLAAPWLGGPGATVPDRPAQQQADSAVVAAPQVVGAIPEPEPDVRRPLRTRPRSSPRRPRPSPRFERRRRSSRRPSSRPSSAPSRSRRVLRSRRRSPSRRATPSPSRRSSPSRRPPSSLRPQPRWPPPRSRPRPRRSSSRAVP